MRLHSLDLNLLLALDALLTLRSVSGAARKLHVTQPTMSGSLARLREHYNDPLLIRVGMGMELTPLAEILIHPVQDALERIEAVATIRPDFNPAEDRRHFNVCASDHTVHTLLLDVIRQLAAEAPGITLRVLPPDPLGMQDRLRRHEFDFVFTNQANILADHPQANVITDTLKCVVWSGNTTITDSVSLAQFTELGHAVARFGDGQGSPGDQQALERAGVKRREEIACPSPLLLGALVVATQRITMMPTRLARQQAAALPLRVLAPPIELPSISIVMQWHKNRERDGATRWVRDVILQMVDRHCLNAPME